MFTGYHFFDYKYDIPNYNEYDYDHFGRYLFLILAVTFIVLFLILLRKTKKENVLRYLKIVAIGLTSLYVIKTTWESVFDIMRSGSFNLGLLPLDTCSLVMPAAFMASFGKGKVQKLGADWLATGGVIGGLSNILFLQALKYYPFFV